MTRGIDIVNEVWTLVTIKSCTFQPSANMQVTESATAPTDWTDPKKIVLKSKMYEYSNTEGSGLWALSSGNALIEIDDNSAISESGSGFLRSVINPISGGLDVNLQDQTTPTIIEKFNQVTGSTTLAVQAVVHDYTFTVADASGIAVGSHLIIFSTELVRFTSFDVLEIDGNVLTVDSQIDAAFPVGSFVDISIVEMAVDGSVTPQIFGLRGLGIVPGIELTIDITRIIITCLTDDSVDLATFGDLPRLTRGLMLRHRNGETFNIFNVKSNGEIAGITLDWIPFAATNPNQGQNGFTARLTFASQGKLGVVQRLKMGEDLEFVIQDDLTDLETLQVFAEGHVVE